MTSTSVSITEDSHFAVAISAHAPLRCTMVGTRQPTDPFMQPKRTRQDLVFFYVIKGELSLVDYTPAGEHITLSPAGTLHTAGPDMAQASDKPFLPGSEFLWWHMESDAPTQWLTRQDTLGLLEEQNKTGLRNHWLMPRHWNMLDELTMMQTLHNELMRQTHAWGIGDPGLDADATHILRRIHSHIARRAHLLVQDTRQDERGRRIVQSALVQLRENITRFHTREDLAKVCRCSPGYLSRCFTRYTQRTLKDTMAHYRIALAKDILRTQDVTPKETAYLCGYTSLNYFCRQFKQQTGHTIRHWLSLNET